MVAEKARERATVSRGLPIRGAMPSFLHEGLLELVRDHPAFAADLLTQLLGVDLPHFTEARLADATLNEPVPVEYHADAVVLFVDGKPVFGAIVEAQLQRDDRKRYTWPLYAVGARARYECPFVVIVVTPDPATATWASEPSDLGGSVLYRPLVIGPQGIPIVDDVERAMHEPQLAVLSAMAHGKGDVTTATAVAIAASTAVSTLPEEQRVVYMALIYSALGEAAREGFKSMHPNQRLVKLLMETEGNFMYDAHQELKAEGAAKGEAKGTAKALLKVLAARKIAVTEEQQRRIAECTDAATLDLWLERAATATSVEQVLESSD